jgi:hypothetical protein
MLDLPIWLHETLAIAAVVIAGSWLVLRLAQVGRPREAGCSRCGPRAGGEPLAAKTGIRSKRLRVLE